MLLYSILLHSCNIFSVIIAGKNVSFSARPHGECSLCCRVTEQEDIKFFLYTRSNTNEPQNLYLDDERSLKKSNFNLNHPVVVFVHGFTQSITSNSSQNIKDAFLKVGNYNVIIVDWSILAVGPWYINAIDNLPTVGRYTARFLHFLIKSGLPVKSIHLIGFSLGAEIVGFVGKEMRNWNILLPRITGLDPSRFLFNGDSSRRGLSYKTADFVDVIHTDVGLVGSPEAFGHADFYPNDGRDLQPGCIGKDYSNIFRLDIIYCSHLRAVEYFVESIQRPQAFLANKCEPSEAIGICNDNNGRAFMGFGAERTLRGKFFLDTNDASPYGRNAANVIVLKPNKQQYTELDKGYYTIDNENGTLSEI